MKHVIRAVIIYVNLKGVTPNCFGILSLNVAPIQVFNVHQDAQHHPPITLLQSELERCSWRHICRLERAVLERDHCFLAPLKQKQHPKRTPIIWYSIGFPFNTPMQGGLEHPSEIWGQLQGVAVLLPVRRDCCERRLAFPAASHGLVAGIQLHQEVPSVWCWRF